MTKIDLHNHTHYCNHATGTMREYIEEAIQQNVDFFGFSCHAPMDYDEKYRMNFCEMEDYLHQIDILKQEYIGRCHILCGLEVDYLPQHMDNRVLNAQVDYLIGSVHFLGEWGFDNPQFIGEYQHKDMELCWKQYLKTLREMANMKAFDIVGHCDLLKIFNHPLPHSLHGDLLRTLKAFKQADIVLEINTAGLRKPIAELYPSTHILKEAFALHIPITFGSDAHSIDQVGFKRNEAYHLALHIGYKEAASFQNRCIKMHSIC
ncbi:histidinol phosphate phosphatase [Helicobacter monodelphidis]|uniref:histidinol-phosphatase n=1 Tax=Helicobacter sp. 15-1451 TaxID=2004995 RepID=UPI000DCE5679|nr:histidinol-phosphatase [Helicobacter sp. 15-1451]RAX59296.1 histidinol phosphate phosphatase [Helicobacter sp. 15-1451]